MKTNNTCTTFKVGRKDAEDQLKRELCGDISVNPEKREERGRRRVMGLILKKMTVLVRLN